MKKILFFLEHMYPSNNSTAYYSTEIIKIASEIFTQGGIFCATPLGNHSKELELSGAFFIKRFHFGKLDKNNLITRLLKFILISLAFFAQAIFRIKRGDIVFCGTNPAFSIAIFALLKKIFRFKYILQAYDIFPENVLAANLTSPDSFAYKISKRFFDWSYSQADYVISIGRDMTEVLKNKGVDESKIVLIQNWVAPRKIQCLNKHENPIIKKLGWEQKIVFMFAGNIGRVQGIDNLLKAIELCDCADAAFLFVGDGQMLPTVKQFQSDHPEKNLFCTGAMPMAEQNIFLNACDIAIVTLGKNMFGLGVPSKSYFSMASGRPILYIGESNSEIALKIKENGIGWIVESGNCCELAKEFKRIASLSKDELKNMGVLSRNVAETQCSDTNASQKYKKLFKKVIES